jgi:DNA-binding transcriptional ArsR family regulator
MAYRIHFTSQDLARTRVAEGPMALPELVLAVRALQDRSQRARLDGWRRHSGAVPLSAGARMVISLIPPVGYSPSYLGPALPAPYDEGLEHIRAIPRSEIRAQMAALAKVQRVPAWARHLADDPALYQELCDGLGHLHSTLLAPYWDQITNTFAADLSVRTRQLAGGGIDSLLSQANPRYTRWVPPVLEIRMPNGVERDLYLKGQGVRLVPSVFASRTLVDDEDVPQPTVFFPAVAKGPLRALTIVGSGGTAPGRAAALVALLGQTRSAVLNLIAEHPGCSTKELAGLARVAPPTASEHATVLRDAGLIQTTRYRNRVIHTVTGLGLALLEVPDRDGRT